MLGVRFHEGGLQSLVQVGVHLGVLTHRPIAQLVQSAHGLLDQRMPLLLGSGILGGLGHEGMFVFLARGPGELGTELDLGRIHMRRLIYSLGVSRLVQLGRFIQVGVGWSVRLGVCWFVQLGVGWFVQRCFEGCFGVDLGLGVVRALRGLLGVHAILRAGLGVVVGVGGWFLGRFEAWLDVGVDVRRELLARVLGHVRPSSPFSALFLAGAFLAAFFAAAFFAAAFLAAFFAGGAACR